VIIEAPPGLVVGFVLASVRAAAWLLIVPPFATRGIPAQVKIGLAAAIALPVAPVMQDAAPPMEVAPLVGAIVLQVVVGVTLGFMTALLFNAAQAAGEFIDMMAGFSIAQILDPISGQQAAPFGRFYQLMAVTLLFALDGHLLVVKGFMRSFDVVSVTFPSGDGLAELLIGGLTTFMVAAIEIAAPLLAALFLAEVALGLLARSAPQMNVFLLGLPFKILLTLSLAGLALPLLPGGVTSLIENGVRAGSRVVELTTGGG